jgi:aryl-alcohol dehydrogenase-like predicted oxidoreductase
VVPIPGTKRLAYMRENTAAAAVALTPEDLAWIEEKIPAGAAFGNRYSDGAMQLLDV